MIERILIIEDDPDGQALVSHVVDHLNIPHDVVGDGESAVDMLADNDYSIVIIDLALPQMDGWQVLAHIRDNDATADLICIAITAFHTSKTREDALVAGFDAYFSKPLDATQFARQLEGLLQ